MHDSGIAVVAGHDAVSHHWSAGLLHRGLLLLVVLLRNASQTSIENLMTCESYKPFNDYITTYLV